MALKLADVVEEMKSVFGPESGLQPWQRADRILELMASFLVNALARDADKGQVAVLMVVPEHRQLTFIYPPHLGGGNVLPVAHDSFAGQAVLEKKVVIENRVPEEPHKDFFERIVPKGKQARSIQKMIAAPMLDGEGQVIGIIELSRTGTSPEAAGGDFTSVDGANLEKCCRVFAPFVARTWNQKSGQ